MGKIPEISQAKRRLRELAAQFIPSSVSEAEALDKVQAFSRVLKCFAVLATEINLVRQRCVTFGILRDGQRRSPIVGCLPALASFCDCQIWLDHSGNQVNFTFFGFASHVAVAQHLFLTFERALASIPAELESPNPVAGGRAKRRPIEAQRQLAAKLIDALLVAAKERSAELVLGKASGIGPTPQIKPFVDTALRALRLRGSKTKDGFTANRTVPLTGLHTTRSLNLSLPGQDVAVRTTVPEAVRSEEQSAIVGKVEGLVGIWLVGWALNLRQLAPCTILIVDEAGTVLSISSARIVRPDLQRLGFGRDNFSFRAPLKQLGDSRRLNVFANGVELEGSPIVVGSGLFDGVASLENGVVEGWVYERRSHFEPPSITLLDQDDNCIGEVKSRREEDEDQLAPAKFKAQLVSNAFGRDHLVIRVAANNIVFHTIQADLELVGCIDNLDEGQCRGWLLCRSIPGYPFVLEVWRDGLIVGSGNVSQLRSDLLPDFPDHPNAGFDFKLKSAALTSRSNHRVSLRLQGSDRDLFGGPFISSLTSDKVLASQSLGRAIRMMHDFKPLQRAVLREALSDYANQQRSADDRLSLTHIPKPEKNTVRRRLSILLMLAHQDSAMQTCVESVLACRNVELDAIALFFSDNLSAAMSESTREYARHRNVYLLSSSSHDPDLKMGRVGLSFFETGDVVVIKSTIRVFPGVLDELRSVAHSSADIGVVSSLSSCDPGFSYPPANPGNVRLNDLTWAQVSAAALKSNRGRVFDIPIANLSCLLIRRSALDLVGVGAIRSPGEQPNLDEVCARAVDQGFRNVIATGAFVENLEPTSTDKQALFGGSGYGALGGEVGRNKHPTTTTLSDDLLLRAARWSLDVVRYQRALKRGIRYTLVITNDLGGGTSKAVTDMELSPVYGELTVINLTAHVDGAISLVCRTPNIYSVFLSDESKQIFGMLDRLEITSVHVHQLLCFRRGFIEELKEWTRTRQLFYYAHDYYPICPRVTMIDSAGAFCNAPPVEICQRCVLMGGAHPDSRTEDLDPAEHRSLFGDLLSAATKVIAPSHSAADYLCRVFPALRVVVRPHVENRDAFDVPRREGKLSNIVLLGALNSHKGSLLLFELASKALMRAPELTFRVVGYTDIDRRLKQLGNVTITGAYSRSELPALIKESDAQLALFLHRWPETFSYTLSEAVQQGLIPLVPDVGAPAERVRAAGFGYVFGFPIDVGDVLSTILRIVTGTIDPAPNERSPAAFGSPEVAVDRGDDFGSVAGMPRILSGV